MTFPDLQQTVEIIVNLSLLERNEEELEWTLLTIYFDAITAARTPTWTTGVRETIAWDIS